MKLAQQVENAVTAERLFTEDHAREQRQLRTVYKEVRRSTVELDVIADTLEQLSQGLRRTGIDEKLAKNLAQWSNQLDDITSDMKAAFKAGVDRS